MRVAPTAKCLFSSGDYLAYSLPRDRCTEAVLGTLVPDFLQRRSCASFNAVVRGETAKPARSAACQQVLHGVRQLSLDGLGTIASHGPFFGRVIGSPLVGHVANIVVRLGALPGRGRADDRFARSAGGFLRRRAVTRRVLRETALGPTACRGTVPTSPDRPQSVAPPSHPRRATSLPPGVSW